MVLGFRVKGLRLGMEKNLIPNFGCYQQALIGIGVLPIVVPIKDFWHHLKVHGTY